IWIRRGELLYVVEHGATGLGSAKGGGGENDHRRSVVGQSLVERQTVELGIRLGVRRDLGQLELVGGSGGNGGAFLAYLGHRSVFDHRQRNRFGGRKAFGRHRHGPVAGLRQVHIDPVQAPLVGDGPYEFEANLFLVAAGRGEGGAGFDFGVGQERLGIRIDDSQQDPLVAHRQRGG